MAEKLGALLVRKGLISPKQLEEVLTVQMIYGGRMGTNLVELGYLDLETLGAALGEQRHYPVATVADLEGASKHTLALVTAEVAEKHLAYP
ncbi:MAG: hypothetical protein ACYC8T_32665, partial [Myxococcaceae bacterium]